MEANKSIGSDKDVTTKDIEEAVEEVIAVSQKKSSATNSVSAEKP